MGRPYPVAASSAIELALVGPTRTATVVATTHHATYLAIDDPDATMVCIASADAVRVPCAMILESKSPPPALAPGTIGTVGEGTVQVGSSSYRVNRWWRPSRPRGLGAAPPGRLAAAVRWLTGRVADPLDAAGRAAVADLVEALASGCRPDEPVARLLGRGPGLTPTGDDVLAGALVSLIALGAPAALPLGATVLAAAPDATTTVSVALLRHATRGECIPQLANLLATLANNGQAPINRHMYEGQPYDVQAPAIEALPRAAGALLAVGHCSGAGLLHGVLVGLAIAHSRLAPGFLADTPMPLSLPALPVTSAAAA